VTPSPYPPLSPFPFLFPNSPAVSFTGEFSPKFHLKNRISTYIQSDFSWKEKNLTQVRQIPHGQIFLGSQDIDAF